MDARTKDVRSVRAMCIATVVLAAVLLIGGCAPMPMPTAGPSTSAETPVPATATPATATDTPAPPPPEPDQPTPMAVEETLFPPEMPSAVRGRQTFEANCAKCHGMAGDGSGLAGAANFTDIEFMRGAIPGSTFVQ